MNLENLLQANRGTVVDVRSRSEFSAGHAQNSINIPLQELSTRLSELKTLPPPVILCCASGGRSASASQLLTQHQIECIDPGPWHVLANHQLPSNHY